jgi:hypothetical protein
MRLSFAPAIEASAKLCGRVARAPRWDSVVSDHGEAGKWHSMLEGDSN